MPKSSGIDVTLYPQPILREKTKRVLKIDDSLRLAVEKMFKLTYKKNGYGMAGPQIGLSQCFFVMNANPWNTLARKDNELVFINPRIECSGKLIKETEGCLSLPGFTAAIPRYETVIVKAKNLEGEKFTYEAQGKEARIIQHEVDHLEGKLILDYASLAEEALQKKSIVSLEKKFKLKDKLVKTKKPNKIKIIEANKKKKKVKHH